MKILYGIQGTGHGHISRARELLPFLSEQSDVDILISGYNSKLELKNYNVIRHRGFSLEYDADGSVSLYKTARNCQPLRFLQDVHSINISDYNLIISDYEPITSWAALTTPIPCIGLSHQAAFLSEHSPRPVKRSLFAEQLLRHFAPCDRYIGFHFQRYDKFIEPPIIRKQVRNLKPTSGDHVTVYLPAFDYQTLISIFKQISSVRWEIFTPFSDFAFTNGNVKIHPIDNESFLKSMESSLGVVTSAGFETCAETMYLGKKLFIIPIKNQYEQLCNAAALKQMGVTVNLEWGQQVKNLLQNWLIDSPVIQLDQIADTEDITKKLLRYSRMASSRKPSVIQ